MLCSETLGSRLRVQSMVANQVGNKAEDAMEAGIIEVFIIWF